MFWKIDVSKMQNIVDPLDLIKVLHAFKHSDQVVQLIVELRSSFTLADCLDRHDALFVRGFHWR